MTDFRAHVMCVKKNQSVSVLYIGLKSENEMTFWSLLVFQDLNPKNNACFEFTVSWTKLTELVLSFNSFFMYTSSLINKGGVSNFTSSFKVVFTITTLFFLGFCVILIFIFISSSLKLHTAIKSNCSKFISAQMMRIVLLCVESII